MVDLVRKYPNGKRDGVAPVAGEIGERLYSAGIAVTWVNSVAQQGGNSGLTITPGIWLVKADMVLVTGTSTGITFRGIGVHTNTGNVTPLAGSENRIMDASTTPVAGSFLLHSPYFYVRISSPTIYYPKVQINGTVGTSTVLCNIEAIRIA